MAVTLAIITLSVDVRQPFARGLEKQYDRIHQGMTYEEVRAILGQANPGSLVNVFEWGTEDVSIVVRFDDHLDRVAAKGLLKLSSFRDDRGKQFWAPKLVHLEPADAELSQAQ